MSTSQTNPDQTPITPSAWGVGLGQKPSDSQPPAAETTMHRLTMKTERIQELVTQIDDAVERLHSTPSQTGKTNLAEVQSGQLTKLEREQTSICERLESIVGRLKTIV